MLLELFLELTKLMLRKDCGGRQTRDSLERTPETLNLNPTNNLGNNRTNATSPSWVHSTPQLQLTDLTDISHGRSPLAA